MRNLLALTVVMGCICLAGAVAGAQEGMLSEEEGLRILRETPVNVPELIEKVKRGVVVVQPIMVEGVAAAEFGGLGSGFVIDKQGHIITNTHVAGKASVAQIVFWDGSSARATLVAAAPHYDIALLKLDNPDPDHLFPVPLGDSDRVRPGDLALAMGAPGSMEGFNIDRSDPLEAYGLRSTATMRVVSGRYTDINFQVIQNYYLRGSYGLTYAMYLPYVFRTQSPINPGNSGGPLFNQHGEVIGINTWGGSHMLSQQTNFSVPINSAKSFVVEVLEHKRQDIPWLGIHCIFPPNIKNPEAYVEFKERFRPEGLWVYSVEPDSPAEAAGLLEGDEIVALNGKAPPTPEELRLEVLQGELGVEYFLGIRRSHYEFTVRLFTVPKPDYVANFSV